MVQAKQYFQDKAVLLFLSLNFVVMFVAIVSIILRLSTNSGDGYIAQYRANLGIGAFKTGSSLDFLYFIFFAVLVVAFHVALSLKTYHIHRQLAVLLLIMSVFLLVVTIIVSNALLVLR
jgi:hypothetical protein